MLNMEQKAHAVVVRQVESSLVRGFIDEARAGSREAQKLLAMSLAEAQSALLGLMNARGVRYRDVQGQLHETAIGTIWQEYWDNAMLPQSILPAKLFIIATTSWLANVAWGWLRLWDELHITGDDVLKLIRYWLEDERCVFFDDWLFTREQIAHAFAEDRVFVERV